MGTQLRRFGLLLGALALLAAACGGDDDDAAESSQSSGKPDPEAEEVRAVPDEYDTIQAAVDDAKEGDLVLVSPGTYKEAVTVTTPDIVIRGLDRNEVILDGEFKEDNGIRVVEADGVAVENMTARNYAYNGFFWTDVERYRGSYLTAHNNGDYGIYAFNSVHGLLEHSYGGASPDAGFYIGQCYPCDAVMDDVEAENNGLGYSGTNSGGDLFIVNSSFHDNRAGIVPNSGTNEEKPPERETTIVGNLVYNNNNGESPAIDDARMAQGNGILIAGGVDNVVERNQVWDHDLIGIGLTLLPDPIEAETIWPATGNTMRGNVVANSGLADLGAVDEDGDENCFEDNEFATTAPANLEELMPCEGEGVGDRSDGALDIGKLATTDGKPESADYRTIPEPELDFESMPDADTAPWEKAGEPPAVDIEAIQVPAKP